MASTWTLVRVHATWHGMGASLRQGTYKVTIPARITNAAGQVIIPAGVYASGQLQTEVKTAPSLDLLIPATDAPTNEQSGWKVTIEVAFTGEAAAGERYVIDVPYAARPIEDGGSGVGVDLRTVAMPTQIPQQVSLYRVGVPGGLAQLNELGQVVDSTGTPVTGEGGGGPAGDVTWSSILEKPAVFPADLTGVVKRINTVTPDGAGMLMFGPGDIGAAPSAHGHAVSDVTGLQSLFDERAPAVHQHPAGDIVGLQDTLDEKAPLVHDHTAADITGVLDPAHLGTGTADAATVLHGDGVWRTPAPAGTQIVLLAEDAEVPDPPGEGVLYLRPAASGPRPDTTPPSVPSGLTSSGVSTSAFALSWDASTDNVGVDGYEARVDNQAAFAKTAAQLSHAFTGLDAGTEYAAAVRAKDYAGNWSGWSAPLLVTTAEAGVVSGASTWGDNPWPDPITGNTDGPATLFAGFYTSRTEGMNVLGARVFLPEGLASSFYNTNINVWTLVLSHAHSQGRPPGDLAAQVAQAGMAAPLVPGWNEVVFAAPVHVNQFTSGVDNAIWIGIRYETGPNYLTSPRMTLSDNSIEFPDAPGVYKGYPALPEYGNNIVGIQNGPGPYPIDILVEP